MRRTLLFVLYILLAASSAFLSAQEPAKALPADTLLRAKAGAEALPADTLLRAAVRPDSLGRAILSPADTLLRAKALPADTLRASEVRETALDSLVRSEAGKPVAAKAEAGKMVSDSLAAGGAKEVPLSETQKPKGKSSKAALLWSIIPGGGQIYNEAYWKIPIVIGIYTACTYAITWNNTALMEYQNAYRDLLSDKPLENTSWQDFVPPGADLESYITNSSFQDQLRRGRDFYRRYRDLSIIVTVGMYFLVALDAYVDAELSSFDVTPNLALQASPTVIPPQKSLTLPQAQTTGLGVSLAFTF